MMNTRTTDPLHGKTLQVILEYLVAIYGWEELGKDIRIRCFTSDPSISSSLTFLRKTPWARKKLEGLYLDTLKNGGADISTGAPIDLAL